MFNRFLLLTIPKTSANFHTNCIKLVKQNHYDVLELPHNCSAKDIKNAFIELSKKYHPDINTNEGSQKKFVRVLEAYNILSKPETRLLYDRQLMGVTSNREGFQYNPPTGYPTGYGYDDPSFWTNRKKYYHNHDRSGYYGIPGLQRVSNGVIALICIIFTSIGVTLQFLAIRHSFTLRRDVIMKQSQENRELLSKIEDDAERNGNEYQIEMLEKKFRNNRFYQPSIPKE